MEDSGSFPEFVVTREVFDHFFAKPLPSSTFQDLVKKGKVLPFKSMRGHFYLNESLRRMGLKQVKEIPGKTIDVTLEDIVRFAFSMIDPDVFPKPSWLMYVDGIAAKDIEYALLLGDRHRDAVELLPDTVEKFAYFQGVLDWASMVDQSEEMGS